MAADPTYVEHPRGQVPTADTRLRELVAQAVPGYEIGTELGRGGSGVVFNAVHRRLGRRAALKALDPAVAANQEIRERFLVEGEVLAALDHPGIVSIYDNVESDGVCVLVMELVAGRDLWSQFRESGMAWRASCVAMLALCAALEHAHGRGVLHRDVKPANVLVSDQGVVKVIDFGIAKMIGGGRSYSTETGQLLGTPAYMAPEQIDDGVLSVRTDVYCAGTVFYELLSGDVPFPDQDFWAVLGRKIKQPPEPLLLRDAEVPTALAEVAMRAVARDAKDRYPSAGALGAAIAAAAELVWGAGWEASPDAALVAGPTTAAGPGTRRVFPSVSQHVDGRFALAIHEIYRAQRAAEGRSGGDAVDVEWEDLPEALKVSSQAFADDIFVKLRDIGYSVHPVFGRDIVVLELTAAELEDLSKKEHRRWVAERREHGWTAGPVRDAEKKVTPYLVGWDELTEDIKEYDRVLVRKIPEILAGVRLEIRRPEQPATA